MPLKIKIPKHTQASESSQSAQSSRRRVYSDVEEDYSREATEEPVSRPRLKRTRTIETGANSGAPYDEGEDDVDVNVDVVDDEVSGRPRTAVVRDPSPSTSPPPVKAAKRSSKATTSGQRGSTASASKPKRKTRQVIWTDDEDDDVDPLGLTAMDPDDEEFEPEPSAPKRSGSKSKIPKTSTKPSRTKTKVEEKDIVIRDERKLPPPEPPTPKDKPPAPRIPLKRAPSSDERLEAPVEPISTASADVPESTPQKVEEVEPPPKKRKLPTIKKNKPSTGPSTPTPAKVPAAVAPAPESSTPSKDPTGPVGVAARKPAAALGAADFDLRDKSVYDQLFNRSKQTPDSGLNRKQREEERRKQLYKLRDEARAKRMEEAKHAFDLQAAHDKIVCFEEKLRAHNSIALYPNVLGAYWKDPRR